MYSIPQNVFHEFKLILFLKNKSPVNLLKRNLSKIDLSDSEFLLSTRKGFSVLTDLFSQFLKFLLTIFYPLYNYNNVK